MHELAPLIRDLAIMMVVAGIVTIFFQKIRQPVVLGYLVAGIIIGPYVPPGILVEDLDNIRIISELGVIFLLFSLGLEFSFQKLMRVGFSASITGILEVLLMIVVGFGAGKLLGWSDYDSLFLGSAIAISSSIIIVKAMEELGLAKKRFAELVFGISIVDDLLAILLLVFLTTLVTTKNVFSFGVLWATGKLLLVVVSWFVLGYFLIPTIFRRITQYVNDETLTIVSVGLCLLLVNVAAYFHYSTALGAFIMGSILAETPLIHRIRELINPIRDIFAAVFFISVGILINPILIVQHWPIVLLITLITILGKIIGNGAGALLTGQSLNTSLRVGCAMAQIGEFSFIIVGLGAALHATSDVLYPIIVAVSAITAFTTPYLIHYSGKLANAVDARLSIRTKYLLDAYSDSIFRILSRSKNQIIYRTTLVRLIVNGIIVVIIFTLVKKFLFPELVKTLDKLWIAEVLSWIVALLLSFPFIWGMMFSYRKQTTLNKKIYFYFLSFILLIIVLAELIALSLSYFHDWRFLIVFFSFSAVVFFILYRNLEKIYFWFEQQLLQNIKRRDIQEERYNELAPWDTHLVKMIAGDSSPLCGKKLIDWQLHTKFNINIVAIIRGTKTILLPGRNDNIQSGDNLIILGNDEQIDQFRKEVETSKSLPDPEDVLESLMLKGFFLEKSSYFINKTIKELKKNKELQALIVGLERHRERILNPRSSMVLKAGDILFLVGEREYLKTL